MTVSAISSSSGTSDVEESTFSSKVLHVAKVIAQMAARVIFVLGSIVLTAAALPVDWYSIGLPIAAVVSAFVSSTFFQKNEPKSVGIHASPAPKRIIPKEWPRGIANEDNNCAFNSLFQFVQADPEVKKWIDDPNSASALQKACQAMSQACEKAVQQDDAYISGSNELRLALRGLGGNGISDNSSIQEDAAECLTAFLGAVPLQRQLQCTIKREYDVSLIDPAQLPDKYSTPQKEVRPCMELALKQKQQGSPLDLQQMLNYELDNDERIEGVNVKRRDGKTIPCAITRTRVDLQQAPQTLYLQLKRFTIESQSGKSFPKKLDTEVTIPNELTIQVQGAPQVYQLASFVHHRGDSPDSGHYTAGRIINGKRYFMNDDFVTEATDLSQWERYLKTSYLLCYVPKIAQDRSSARLPV